MATDAEQLQHRCEPPATGSALHLPHGQTEPAGLGQNRASPRALPSSAEPPPVAAAGAAPRRLGLGVVAHREPPRADDHVEQLAGQRLDSSGYKFARSAPGDVHRRLLQTGQVDRAGRHVEIDTDATVRGGHEGSFRLLRTVGAPCLPRPNYTDVSSTPRYRKNRCCDGRSTAWEVYGGFQCDMGGGTRCHWCSDHANCRCDLGLGH